MELTVKVVEVTVVVVLSLHLSLASVLPAALPSTPGSQASSPYQYSLSLREQGRTHQTGRPDQNYSLVWVDSKNS